MSAVAALLSIILFLAFGSAGVQKIRFNPVTSHAADRLDFTKRAYQRIGGLEVIGAIVLLIGLAAKGSSILAILNEVAAAAFFVLMLLAVVRHLRKGDAAKFYTPALALGVVSLIEMIARLLA